MARKDILVCVSAINGVTNWRPESAHAKQMDFDMAISDYPEAVRLNPHSAGAYYNRGNA
jgi:hypothetical protein